MAPNLEFIEENKITILANKAKVTFPAGTSINVMLKTAIKRMEMADFHYLNKEYEEAYLYFSMALNILFNDLKLKKEYQTFLEKGDPNAIKLNKSASFMLEKAELSKKVILKQEKKRHGIDFKKTPVASKPLPKIPDITPSNFIGNTNNYGNNDNNKITMGVNSIPPTETLITPNSLIPLLNNYNLTGNPTILFIDVRPSYQFQEERMNVTQLVNLEPLVLKRNVNCILLEENLKLHNTKQYQLFKSRHLYDYVIMLDQDSTRILMPTNIGEPIKGSQPLHQLMQALTTYEYTKKLKHPPILLVGGLEGWKKKTLDAGVLKGPDKANIEIFGEEFKERDKRSAISKASGKLIVRNLLDYQKKQALDGELKQSMQFPSEPQTISNIIQPNTSHESISSVSFQPTSNKVINPLQPEEMMPNKGNTLQRRKTKFDNPYYGFTPTKKEFTSYQNELQKQKAEEINEGSYIPPKQADEYLPEFDNKNRVDSIPVLVPTKLSPPIPSKPEALIPKPTTPQISSLSYAMNIGKTGLKNLGNTCYMNSIIQCINGTIPLARYFLDGSYRKCLNRSNPMGHGGKLADGFYELIKALWTESLLNYSPVSFKRLVGTLSSNFAGTEQQDSQEFLAFLLDGLHEDLNLVHKKPIFNDDDLDNLPDQQASDLAWERYLKRDNSVITSLFLGQLKSRLQCLVCGKTSTTYNSFMYLSLPIPKGKRDGDRVSLLECLNTFVEVETLEGDDAWHCPKCKKPSRATKQLTISRLPDVLLVHLKRFSYSGPFRNKLNTHVDFPTKRLDLSNYVPLTAPKSNILSPRGQPLGNSYDLYAVSNHYGSLTGGHYTAYVRSGYGGKWHLYDDSRVSVIQEKDVVTKAGYNLFYVRTNSETAHL